MQIKTDLPLKKDLVGKYLSLEGRNLLYEGDIVGSITEDSFSPTRKVEVLDEDTVSPILFVRLHGHSEFSFLDGIASVKKIAEKCRYAAAITDHGYMSNVLQFQKAMQKSGKKAILGFEAYTDSIISGEEGRFHLVLLAKNNTGLKNLFHLCSESFQHFNGKPITKWSDIMDHSEGIICLTACMAGEVAKTVENNEKLDKKSDLIEVVSKMKAVFKDDLYLEIQRHDIQGEMLLNSLIQEVAIELGIKLVATDDAHYANKEDKETHQIALCLQTQSTISKPAMQFNGDGYHIHTEEEMLELFKDIPEAVFNTVEVAEKCNSSLSTGEYHIPVFPIPAQFENEFEYLKHLCLEGYKEKCEIDPKFKNPAYKERLDYELEVISKMGYNGYFLIVWDFINWSKQNGIYIGPGRGSAAGSLALYVMKITEIDPLEFDLLFERFLNPDRVSMPDIDVDIETGRREEVLSYLKDKYGDECVCNIMTFGTFQSKLVFKDVSRVTSVMTPSERNKFTKGFGNAASLKEVKEIPEIAEVIEKNSEVKKVFEEASKLEGNIKNASIHASGVLITAKAVENYMATAMLLKSGEKERRKVIQLDMNECEEIGLLKFDLLGLRTLSAAKHCVNFINKKYGKFIDINTIPMNDPLAYIHLLQGNTVGVFQLESPGMTSLMSELFYDAESFVGKENAGNELFERLVAGIALYRPGPMDEIPNFIERMKDPSKIEYEHPMMESILKTTYGVIIYQEQVITLCVTLAGFSKGEADVIRKAMGKKKQDLIDKYRECFIHGDKELNIKGCVANGIDENIAISIYDKMEKFARYAFNKSHAAGYAKVAVITAWLSKYYPLEWFSGLLNAFIDSPKKLRKYIQSIKSYMNILLPDVNTSEFDFAPDYSLNGIRFGLSGIKGVSSMGLEIVREREKNGEFTSLFDFTRRCEHLGNLSTLANCGALESINRNRNFCLEYVNRTYEALRSCRKTGSSFVEVLQGKVTSLTSFFDEDKIDIKEDFDAKYKIKKEREYLNTYISGSPFDEYLVPENIVLLSDVTEDDDGNFIQVMALIENVEDKTSSNGKKYKKITAEDISGVPLDIMFFEGKKKVSDELLNIDSVLVFQGRLSTEYNLSIMANGVTLPKKKALQKEIFITSEKSIDSARKDFKAVKNLIKSLPAGNMKVTMFIEEIKESYSLGFVHEDSIELLHGIWDICGQRNVRISNI